MFKKISSLIIAFSLLVGCLSLALPSASADSTMDVLVKMIKKFPAGKYWNHPDGPNNPDGVSSTPCASHRSCDYFGGCSCNSYGGAIQCMGYAAKVSYDITGVDRYEYEERSSLNVADLCVGDIIRYNNYHSIMVTGVSGTKIAITDCNYGENCIIRWTVIDASSLKNVTYVLHLKGNNMKNSDINWHLAYGGTDINGNTPAVKPTTTSPTTTTTKPTATTKPTEPGTDIPSKAEIWQMEKDSSLNVRSSMNAASSSNIIGSIGGSEKFYVTAKSFDGEYLWAKVTYGNLAGYSVLNYAEYVSGAYETLNLSKLESSYGTSEKVPLSWNKIGGADKYEVTLYDESKKPIKTYSTDKTSYTLPSLESGSYYVKVTAKSSVASSWTLESAAVSFKIKDIAVTGIALNKTSLSTAVSGSYTLKAEVTPSNATNKELSWKSSDTSILTVDSKGNIKCLKPGRVTVKCTSKQNSKISASCTVTVYPSLITVTQNTKGTTNSTITLTWNKSEGATAYEVYRYNIAKKKYDLIGTVTSLSYTDKNLKASSKYTYVVRPTVKTEVGVLRPSYKAVTAYTKADKITKILQTGSDTGRIKFTWSKVPYATDYVVYKYVSDKKEWVKLGVTKGTSFIDSDKAATKVYYKVISAVKTTGGYLMSPASVTFSGYTGLAKPTVTVKTNASAVKLSWSAVSGATHYQVYRLEKGKYVKLATFTADNKSFTDTKLKGKTAYTYVVRAARVHSSTLNLYSSNVTVKATTA